MKLLLVFDDLVKIESLISVCKNHDVSEIVLIPLITDPSAVNSIANSFRSQGYGSVTMLNSAQAIDEEVKQLRKGICKWSAEVGRWKIKSKNVGLFRVSFGVESVNEEFRIKRLGRDIINEKMLRYFEINDESGIQYSINCMIGFPFETREMVFDTIRLVKQMNPLPGLKPGVSGIWHTWHDLRPCQTMPGKASASLRKDAIHPQV